MSEHTPDTTSEGTSPFVGLAQVEGTATDITQEVTGHVVLAKPQAQTEPSGSVEMDIRLTTTREWCREFKQASPSQRAVMLSVVMDLFNDGQEGIDISFSEPVIS